MPRRETSGLYRKSEEEERKYKMDVMELVENEPNARPFQCDWQTCNKVRTWNELDDANVD